MFETYGKLVTLWFDRAILHVPTADSFSDVCYKLAERGELISRTAAEELCKLWIPVQRVLPDYRFLEDGLFHKDNARVIADAAFDFTTEVMRRAYPDAPEGALAHEVAWAGAGLIDTVTTWAALQTKAPCSLLADKTETRFVQQVFSESPSAGGFDCFAEAIRHNVPNLDAVPWERIIELRDHRFLRQFREKIKEIQSCIRSGERKTAVQMLAEMKLRDLEEIARLTRSALGKTVLKAFCSNIPLPIPINPISIGLGLREVAEAYQRGQRFGWLYFFLDLSS